MPSRTIVAGELSALLKVIAHPDRIRLIEELNKVEMDVNTLSETLDLPAARVSQHLAVLRAHRLVMDRREGRHHVYCLTQPLIADWIVDGIEFVGARDAATQRATLMEARRLWSQK